MPVGYLFYVNGQGGRYAANVLFARQGLKKPVPPVLHGRYRLFFVEPGSDKLASQLLDTNLPLPTKLF
jgi:hypothetical protein